MQRELMGDLFMIFAIIAVLLTPFFPILLRGKCPACKRRKLETLGVTRNNIQQNEGKPSYWTFYRCLACLAQFKQDKAGSFQTCNEGDYESALKQSQSINS